MNCKHCKKEMKTVIEFKGQAVSPTNSPCFCPHCKKVQQEEFSHLKFENMDKPFGEWV